MAMPGANIKLGRLVPNKMVYLISLWETFDVRSTAIHEIYLRTIFLQQQNEDREVLTSAIGCT